MLLAFVCVGTFLILGLGHAVGRGRIGTHQTVGFVAIWAAFAAARLAWELVYPGRMIDLFEDLLLDPVFLASAVAVPVLFTRKASLLVGLVNLLPRQAFVHPLKSLVFLALGAAFGPTPALLGGSILVLRSNEARALRAALRLEMVPSGSGYLLATGHHEVRLELDHDGDRIFSVIGGFGQITLSLGVGEGREGIALGVFTLGVGGEPLDVAAALGPEVLHGLESLAPYGVLEVNNSEITLRAYREATLPADLAWRLIGLADTLTIAPEDRAGRARAHLGTDLLVSGRGPASSLATRLYALEGVLASGQATDLIDGLLMSPTPLVLESTQGDRAGRVEMTLRAAAWRVDHGDDRAAPRLREAAGLLADSSAAWHHAELLRLLRPDAPPARLRALEPVLLRAASTTPGTSAAVSAELRRAATRALARIAPQSAVAVIVPQILTATTGELTWMCQLLVQCAPPGDPAVRAALKDVLIRPRDTRTDTSGAYAIGTLGTIDDVPALYEQRRLSATGSPRAEALDAAIAAIQSRLGGARGTVSLAAAEGGEVSIAAHAGAVSVKR
jgi:hypothetical protein